MTHDCGTRAEPSYLGCEGCYCANAIDPVNPQQGFAPLTQSLTFAAGCYDIFCEVRIMLLLLLMLLLLPLLLLLQWCFCSLC